MDKSPFKNNEQVILYSWGSFGEKKNTLVFTNWAAPRGSNKICTYKVGQVFL